MYAFWMGISVWIEMRSSVDVRLRLDHVAPRLNDRCRQQGPAANLLPLRGAHEVGDGKGGAEVDGDAAGVEVRLDHVERHRAAGEHLHVADGAADRADVVGAAEVLGRV